MSSNRPRKLKLYSTLARRKMLFEPLEPGRVGMYICGPTVYSDPHIGNFRSFLMGDIVRRWLEYRGYDVFQVMNITDIDDKTIRDSGREGVSLKEFTERYARSFLRGIDLLNIKRAMVYPQATDLVSDMIEFIQGLLDKGLAYIAGDGVYYDIDKFQRYGALSGVDLTAVQKTERISADEYDKETPNDFVLWKMSTTEDIDRGIFYDSPWGRGRPGWHIECSVMSRKYLGDTLDIHSGGEDLIFPHHENEIAQSEGLTGKQFVRFWMHVGFLKINGRKMSKSLGNYVSFDEVLSRYAPNAFRYFYLSTHYRKQIDYTEEAMKNAESSAQRLMNTIDLIEQAFHDEDTSIDYTHREDSLLSMIHEQKRRFENAMDDDLDTHGALIALHAISKALNEYLTEPNNRGVLLKAYIIYRKLLDPLGLFERNRVEIDELTESLIRIIVDAREEIRTERIFNLSDKIRRELAEIGVILSDKPDGTSWKIEKD